MMKLSFLSGMKGILYLICILAFVLYVGYMGWVALGPQKPMPDHRRQEAAVDAIGKMVKEIREHRGGIQSAVLMHFTHDETDFFTLALQRELDSKGTLALEDRPLMEKLRNKLSLRNRGCRTLEEALAAGRKAEVEGVLWGGLDQYETVQQGVLLKGWWKLVDCSTGEVVHAGVLDHDSTQPAAEAAVEAIKETEDALERHLHVFSQSAQQIPWYVRFLGFVLLVTLLPILTISFIRAMVVKRANGTNAYTLAIYTLLDGIFAFFMVGASFASGWSVMFFLAALLLAFLYNISIMSFALRLEE